MSSVTLGVTDTSIISTLVAVFRTCMASTSSIITSIVLRTSRCFAGLNTSRIKFTLITSLLAGSAQPG